ncbi:MAG: TerB family tellurite resistance protein [Micavibrio sp.]|nr:MAG: TerB family tellurite resistance protein [Micavibrio sp.]
MVRNTPLSESRFYMWRTLVALVHADHKVMDEEREFFLGRFNSIPFTEEQENILKEDLDTPQEISELYAKIDCKEDRATLVYFARLLFWCDGEFHAQEEEILKHLKEKTISKLDLENVMAEVNDEVRRTMNEYDIEMESSGRGGKSGFFSALFFALSSGFWPFRKLRDLF